MKAVVMHATKRLGKVVRLKTADFQANEITVKLLPMATVRGRLVDEIGPPLANLSVTPIVLPRQRNNIHLPAFRTDTEGNFEFLAPCWSQFRLIDNRSNNAFVDTESVKPGQQYDLGTMRLINLSGLQKGR